MRLYVHVYEECVEQMEDLLETISIFIVKYLKIRLSHAHFSPKVYWITGIREIWMQRKMKSQRSR